MQHNYDTDHLKAAHRVAAKQININELHTTKYLAAFLDALPEPENDDWQECSFEEIRKGDRVRVRDDEGNFLEFTVKYIGEKRLYWQQKYYDDHISFDYVNGIWRLPRPVQHPDPVKHPVIFVHKYSYEDGGEQTFFDPLAMIWNGTYYEAEKARFLPQAIVEFTPAKVVIADD